MIIFGNLYVQFLCPEWNRKKFPKKKGNSRKNKNNILFDLPYHKFLVTSMYSFLCPKWDRENKNNIPFFIRKKLKKKYKFFYSLSHIFAKPLYTALSHGL